MRFNFSVTTIDLLARDDPAATAADRVGVVHQPILGILMSAFCWRLRLLAVDRLLGRTLFFFFFRYLSFIANQPPVRFWPYLRFPVLWQRRFCFFRRKPKSTWQLSLPLVLV